MIREATRPGDSRVHNVLRASVCQTIFAYFVRVVRQRKNCQRHFFSVVPAASDSSRIHCHHSSRTEKNVGHVRECQRPETFSHDLFNKGKQLITDKMGIQKNIYGDYICPMAFTNFILLHLKSHKEIFGVRKFQTYWSQFSNTHILFILSTFFEIFLI